MHRLGEAVVTEQLHVNYEETGATVEITRPRQLAPGCVAIVMKGGLGDPQSTTMKPLVEPLMEAMEGRAIIANVATDRSPNPFHTVFGSFRARQHRSKGVRGALHAIDDSYSIDLVVGVGQSQGGVNQVDSAYHEHTRGAKRLRAPFMGIVTVDGPGVYGPLEYEGFVFEGLVRLARNCLEDMRDLSVTEKFKTIFGMVSDHVSPTELPYFLQEVFYLRNIDMSERIRDLRGLGVGVQHIFHADDMVPGAEVPCDHKLVLPGGHGRFLVEPEPVAARIAELVPTFYDPCSIRDDCTEHLPSVA